MSLVTPQTVKKLQTTLHAKAKESPSYRFYSLYDKMCRRDVLEYAYRCCRAKAGAPGADGQSFDDIKEYGEERWLDELTEMLRRNEYQADAIRRVYIPKPGGKQRPLGIPSVKTRVVQTAVTLVLGAIFEADLLPEQYAYRPKRSALDAVEMVHALINAGHKKVVDADISGYFDAIPHCELMKSVARRVSDGRILCLIKAWLQAPVEEEHKPGKVKRTTRNKDEKRGTPQGAPISPLLSNLYMRRLILGWKNLGHEERFQAKIVNYADDTVICCRKQPEEAAKALRDIVQKLKLTLNEEKTKICHLPKENLDYLGYTVGLCWSPNTGKPFMSCKPSRKKIRQICQEISEETERRWCNRSQEVQVKLLRQKITGWANYFCLGSVSRADRIITQHSCKRLRHWLRRKHQIRGKGITRFPDKYLYKELGIARLRERKRNLLWAKPSNLVREPDAVNPHVGFDEEGVETGAWGS